ncbi:hypothetical protein RND81_02G103900 [Saponaria officinalis]|uniref:ATP synthase F1 complex delta/epsilon subunit N-terminal domain-containing protein n=1 Tax=Saponaria officinalis TaxID=3572 RepID=A0AAW1MSW4_SAPOF
MSINRLMAAGAASTQRFSGNMTAEKISIDARKKLAPNIEPPLLPLSFMQETPKVSSSKLVLDFHLHFSSQIFDQKVDMVIVPATTGQTSILLGHVAAMSELNPDLLSLHEVDQMTEYFINGGFALIHPNSVTDIIAVIDKIDPQRPQKGLAEFSQTLSSAATDYEKAEAKIGVDVHNARLSALTH